MDVSLKCRCGKFTGTLKDASPEKGTHIICRCQDCRAYAKHLGGEGVLDENGGTEIFQVTPSQLTFDGGKEYLSCLRLSKKGLYRWYTSCCNTPIGNTMGSAKIPFVGVIHTSMQLDVLGRQQTLGPILWDGKPSEAGVGMLLRYLRVLFLAWLSGKASPNPFFEAGSALVEPEILSKNN